MIIAAFTLYCTTPEQLDQDRYPELELVLEEDPWPPRVAMTVADPAAAPHPVATEVVYSKDADAVNTDG